MNEGYSWPDTEVGCIASFPCPFSSDNITRQCDSDGMRLQPNISLCGESLTIILNMDVRRYSGVIYCNDKKYIRERLEGIREILV